MDLGEFLSGVYTTVYHLLVHKSKFTPVIRGEATLIWDQLSFVLPVGPSQIRINCKLDFYEVNDEI